jgi:hypothetical protein
MRVACSRMNDVRAPPWRGDSEQYLGFLSEDGC